MAEGVKRCPNARRIFDRHGIVGELCKGLLSLVWLHWCGRLGEFLVVDRNILLHLVDLNCEASARASDGPTKRSPHPAFLAIICVVYLGGIKAKGRIHIT